MSRREQSNRTTDEPGIEELLDRAIQAVNRGDRTAARVLAGRVLAVDSGNAEAEDLLAAPADSGEIRRLTIIFADLVDSTALSTRVEAETYRTVVGRYKDQVRQVIDRYEGHIGSTKGDGLLAYFGHPQAHEDDVRRAVHAGLDITRRVANLSEQVQRRFGFAIDVRVGIHRGVVYLDIVHDDVYGLAANLAARVSGLAPPGTVVVSDAVECLIHDEFDLESLPAQRVKGIEEPVGHHRVLAERAAAVRAPRGPLIGREPELACLRDRWDQARAGTLPVPGVVLIGEPGIGKSRLATAAADMAKYSDGVVLALHGSPLHVDSGLHPIRTLLERRCGIERSTGQPDRLALLTAEVEGHGLDTAATVPLLAPVLGIAAEAGYQPVSVDGQRLYRRIRTAVCDYLVACLADRPAVLLVEDVQWFDTSTTDVVRSLLDTNTGRLLVVLTARDHSVCTEFPGATKVELAPLSDTETEELVAALDPTLDADQRSEVHRRCDGIPLYIEEVVANRVRADQDEQPTGMTEWQRVPDALYEPLFARLRASTNVVSVVEAAATIGREVDRALLGPVTGLPDDALDAVLDRLVSAGVFVPTGPGSWRFRHELLREVAAELAPPSQRRMLHARIADALVDAERGEPDWSLVARHCQAAEQFSEATTACQRAATDAQRRGAFGEARKFFTDALTNLVRLPHSLGRDQREIVIRLKRGFLTSATAGPTSPDAAADFERCLQLSGTNVTNEVLSTLVALFGYYMNRGDLRRAVQLLESGRGPVANGPAWLRAANEVGFATAAWYAGDFDTARRDLERLAAAGGEVDRDAIEATWFMPYEPVASIHTVLALARFVQGDLSGAELSLSRAHRRCAALGFPHGPFSLAYARSLAAWIYAEAGRLDEAHDNVAELTGLARRYGFDSWGLIAAAEQTLVDGHSALTGVQPTIAAEPHIAVVEGVVQAMTAFEVKPFLSVYDALTARLLKAAGRPDAARTRLDDALNRAADTGIHFYDAELLRLRADTCSGGRRVEGLASAAALARRQGATLFYLRSAADLFELSGEPTARRLVEDALSYFPGDSTWPELTRARALLA